MARMLPENLTSMSRRDLLRAMVLAIALIAAALWVSFHFLQPAPPRRIVLASGVEGGLYHRYAQRYREILARDGVTVEERMTNGAAENLRLLQDPASGVDVAFMQGGVATSPAADNIVMLAGLYYEPLWVFYPRRGHQHAIESIAGQTDRHRPARQRHARVRGAAARRQRHDARQYDDAPAGNRRRAARAQGR